MKRRDPEPDAENPSSASAFNNNSTGTTSNTTTGQSGIGGNPQSTQQSVQQEQKYRRVVTGQESESTSINSSFPQSNTVSASTSDALHSTRVSSPTNTQQSANSSVQNNNKIATPIGETTVIPSSTAQPATQSPVTTTNTNPNYYLPPPNTQPFMSYHPPVDTAQQIPPQMVKGTQPFARVGGTNYWYGRNAPSPAQMIPASQISSTSPTATSTPSVSTVASSSPPEVASAASQIPPQQVSPPATQQAGRQSQVKFENALDFLDQVKLQFANQPRVYNQFLDIMKDFKAQCIDTPGVIARVSELFKGHRNLILGFNTFLPPGYKIEYVPDENSPNKEVISLTQPSNPTPQPPHPVVPNASQRKQPEFDHARNYVKKIKMRFANQPHIYKAFLEILHTYHKEQHTIKDVYEQVANLFQSHADLLEEFAQFLPDPVASASAPPTNVVVQNRAQKKAGGRKPKDKFETTKKERLSSQVQEDKLPVPPSGSFEEMNFFYRVKQRLNNQSLYYEFLKCLNLFSQNIITKLELVLLIKDLLAKHRDLFDYFKQFIGFDEASMGTLTEYLERQDDKPREMTSHAEIDFKTCKRYGPSYRALPKNYVQPTCSGRTELCTQVLNDLWVSVPTGSEDGFKSLRKNQYEEMLFKCEDDRFELDLVIELNASTVRTLERVLKSMSEMTEEESARFKLDTALDILHIRSIERIYGDKGPEVIDALYSSPSVTIPVILKRLKQKDQEWIKARREWNKIWREVNEKNYYKSLDHQSFYFKQNDKKNLNPKVLIAEIKQKYQEQLKQKEKIHQERASSEGAKVSDDKMEVEKTSTTESSGYHLKYSFADSGIIEAIYLLIMSYVDRNLTKLDHEKTETFFKHFIKYFFDLENYEDMYNQMVTEENGYTYTKTSAMDVENGTQESKSTTPTKSGGVKKSQDSHIFFGSTPFYIFFRLFQILYERLQSAKDMSKNPQTNSQFAYLLNPSKDKKFAEEKDRYKAFLRLLNAYMGGLKEPTSYEDECRSLFGIQAFILFTMDKLVSNLTKQLQSLLSEELCSKLLGLYSYECSRASGCNEQMYYSNCVELLQDERCFKFEFDLSPNRGDFLIQLLDSYHNPPKYVEFSVDKHEKWSQYVENYVGSEETQIDFKKHHIFLGRNKKKIKEDRALHNVEIHNGLECRICLSTYRLFYVEHTEDFLHRRGKLGKSRKLEQKTTKEAKQARLSGIVDKLSAKLPKSE